MQATEAHILKTLLSFEFIPRHAGEEPVIDTVHDATWKCTVYHIVFPVQLSLDGSLIVITNIDRETGEPTRPYMIVMFEHPSGALSMKVNRNSVWRRELRKAVGFAISLSRELLFNKPKVTDYPDDQTWAQAANDASGFNKAQYDRARARFRAYEKVQEKKVVRGLKRGCPVRGSEAVAAWLKSA